LTAADLAGAGLAAAGLAGAGAAPLEEARQSASRHGQAMREDG